MQNYFLITEFHLIGDFWFISLLVFVIIQAAAIVILFRKTLWLHESVGKNTRFRKNFSDNSNQLPSLQDNLIVELSNRIKKLEVQAKVENVQSSVEKTTSPVYQPEKSVEINLSVPSKPKNVDFFMSTPNEDGTFDLEQMSDVFRPTISLYKFSLASNSAAKASFEFNSDAIGIKDALTNPKRFIEPVCYEINDAFTGSKRITSQKPGTAEKRNDKWVVTTKSQIKYE